MKTVTKIYLIVISVLLATIVGLCFAWQHAKDEAKDANHALALAKVKAVTQQERETRILSELNEEHAININKMVVEKTNIESKFKVELHELKTRYTAITLDNKRLYDKVRILNGELSNLTRASVENYAETAGNNLAACSSVTIELEQLAYQYNTELEHYRNLWANHLKQRTSSGIVVYDEETGLKKTYQEPLKIPVDISKIQIIVP